MTKSTKTSKTSTTALGSERSPRRSGRHLPQDAVDRILTKAELGQFVRGLREGRFSGSAFAKAIGWDRQRLRTMETGQSVSPDFAAWIKMADVLDLSRRYLLGRAWDAAPGGLPLKLPPESDERRKVILDYVIEQFGEPNPMAVE